MSYPLRSHIAAVRGEHVKLPSEIAKEAAGSAWPVMHTLASKPSPYILKPYDTTGDTDYNADFVWHLIGKEKLWDLPWTGECGLFNPNSDIAHTVSVQAKCGKPSVPMLLFHDAATAISSFDGIDDLECEVVFHCLQGDLVICQAYLRCHSTDVTVDIVESLLKGTQTNPPEQPYTLPNQKFGVGVTTTAGGLEWQGASEDGKAAQACFYEWVRGRSRGRRLLASLIADRPSEVNGKIEEGSDERADAVIRKRHRVTIRSGEDICCTFVLHIRRFSTHDTWNPEVTPELYKFETEDQAIRRSYAVCADALKTDMEATIRASVEPYKTMPHVSLPTKTWEADFLSCFEMIRASTFSPLGNIETPFYNFCRVHAHEPFGWWSYGMHAHENLITLFLNAYNPQLSQQFLLGHIRHQWPDGQYPYGVSHTINPRTRTKESTLPLIVWEAWNAYLWSADRDFLAEAYESGRRNHEWWLKTRDRCGEGLCHYINASWESARDDNDLATWTATGGAQFQEALDLNCYLLMQEWTLGQMAHELGREHEASAFDGKALDRAKLMNAYMWHDEDQCYYGIGEVVPGWARVKDISTFFPLWAGLAPNGRFAEIVKLLEDPETFGTPYGPPILAANEPGFGPEKHWMGANWVEMTALVIQGVKRYDYFALAAKLAYQNTKMVFDELEKSGHFREYFNSIDGSGVDLVDYVWTAMPAHFILHVFFGIEPTAEGLEILPALPIDWANIEIKNLSIRGKRISLCVSKHSDVRETYAVINGNTKDPFKGRGVLIPWDELKDEAQIRIIQPFNIHETHLSPAESPRDWSDVPPHQYPTDAAV